MQQPVGAKKGEIEFRKKLYEQEVLGEKKFDDEFSGEKLLEIVRNRVAKTSDQIGRLQERGITTSPYVEIGAERCQRSLAMENELGCHGAATDISFYSLKSCDYYGGVLHYDRAPLRICCDAYNLPFLSNSVPFMFCYETLHHFPDPAPIARQVYRALAPGGCFFFDEEPLGGKMRFDLYQVGKIHSSENLAKSKIRKISDALFGNPSCNEAEHAIIENHRLSLGSWRSALSTFDKNEVFVKTLKSLKRNPLETDLFDEKSYLKRVARHLFGGGVSGCCFKAGNAKNMNLGIEDVIVCPECLSSNAETKLGRRKGVFCCLKCGENYPIVDGVVFLFSRATLNELYPEMLDRIQSAFPQESASQCFGAGAK